MCVAGCGVHETHEHLFLECSIFGIIWQPIRNWVGVYTTLPSCALAHFHQFGSVVGHAKSCCSFMFLVWFTTSWIICKERNNRVFRGKENSIL